VIQNTLPVQHICWQIVWKDVVIVCWY